MTTDQKPAAKPAKAKRTHPWRNYDTGYFAPRRDARNEREYTERKRRK
jgi:hypothetical protein